MKTKFKLVLVALIIAIANGFSQDKKPFIIKQNDDKGDIVMTWNANTPEQEMKDDIKALGEHGVTIAYENVKRNSKDQITAIKVTYTDRKGNKGALEMDNQKPINTIKFFKQGENVGFGEPTSNDFLSSANGFSGFSNGQNPMQLFNFSPGGTDENAKSYSFSFSDDNSSAKSRTFIQKDGKNPLVIEDGKVVQGGDDYTKEELEEIQKNKSVEPSDDDAFPRFNFNDQGNLADQMKKMQEQLNQLMQKQQGNSQPEANEKLLQESKEELEKAKEELKKAKEELQKTKSTLKTQKA